MSNLDESLDAIQQAILDAERAMSISAWDDFDEAVSARLKLVDLKNQLAMLLGDTDTHIIGAMGTDFMVATEDYEIEKRKGSSRKKWQHAEITDTLTQRLIDLSLSEDGEITLSPREAIQKVMEYGHVDYWRAGKLSELDINPDMYCEVEEGKTSLIIRKK